MPIRFGNHRTGRVVLVLTPREVMEKLSRRRVKGKPIDSRRIKLAGDRRKRTIAKYDDSWKWERLAPGEKFVPRPKIEDDVDVDVEGIVDGAAEPAEPAEPAKPAKPEAPDEDVPDPADVREWARSQGIEVSEKGRLPFALVDQYRAATDS